MDTTPVYEDATPTPADLIRSIAEQGYSLQASLADLVDNSISASATQIELLITTDEEPFTLFITDNGNGMDETELARAMQLPSQSPLAERAPGDLGRFGLGMKTASFSQTRKFTVISRKGTDRKYAARTWDLKVLEQGDWKITVETEKSISTLISKYYEKSTSFLNEFNTHSANTIIVWHGLHKFEEFISERGREEILYKELKEITAEHLSIAFHRFMERSDQPIRIRLNNDQLVPFNPFPIHLNDFRALDPLSRTYNNGKFSIEGYVLPSRAISESRTTSEWTTKYKSLLDMEGMYVYRANRLISFGGWSNLTKKSSRHNLARLKVDITNNSDLHLHLNVAKSQVKIPDDLRPALQKYITNLKIEAIREYYNRAVRAPKKGHLTNQDFLTIVRNSKGTAFEVNKNFPLFVSAMAGLTKLQKSSFKALLRLFTVKLNMIKESYEPAIFTTELIEEDNLTEIDMSAIIAGLISSGISKKIILKDIVPDFGYEKSSLPPSILELLK